MTTLVSWNTEKKIYIGADKRTSSFSIISDSSNKIFQQGPVLFSATGLVAHNVLSRMVLGQMGHMESKTPHQILHEFTSRLDHILRSKEGLPTTSNADDDRSSKIILIIKGKFFCVEIRDDLIYFSYEDVDEFNAEGTGSNFATGMYYYCKSINMNPVEALKLMIKEVPRFDQYSGGGGILYEYDKKTTKIKLLDDWS